MRFFATRLDARLGKRHHRRRRFCATRPSWRILFLDALGAFVVWAFSLDSFLFRKIFFRKPEKNIFPYCTDENALRKARTLGSTGGLRSSAPRSNLQLARSSAFVRPVSRFHAAHHAASGRRHSWTTRERTSERRASASRPPPRPAVRPRVARFRSRARPLARIRTRRRRSVERASSRKQRARGPGNAGRTRARDARGAFGAVDFEAKVASRRSEARRTRGRFRRRAIPRARASVEAVSREGFVCDRLRHHEAAGALEDAQAVHDYQEP